MTTKPIEPAEVDKRMYMRLKLVALFLFLWGLLLPQDWQQLLGVFGGPIAWVADFVPSIKKMAAISPMPELIRGYFGLAFLILPACCVWVLKNVSIGKAIQGAIKREGLAKFIYFMILCGIPFSLFVIYFCAYLPVAVQLGLTPTRFQFLLTVIVTYRLGLAVFGTFLILGLWFCLLYLVAFLIGPLI